MERLEKKIFVQICSAFSFLYHESFCSSNPWSCARPPLPWSVQLLLWSLWLSLKQHHCTLLGRESNEQITSDETSPIQGFQSTTWQEVLLSTLQTNLPVCRGEWASVKLCHRQGQSLYQTSLAIFIVFAAYYWQRTTGLLDHGFPCPLTADKSLFLLRVKPLMFVRW